MSDADHFLTRWSRRKRAVAEESAPQDSHAPDDTQAPGHAGDPKAREAAAPAVDTAEPFDLSKLPSIESITADTDIRVFFAPGVPAELTRAALRRAWVADPRIRDFVGLAEMDWDFNNPASIPGFGPLTMTDELRREVAQMFKSFVPEHEPAARVPAAVSDGQPAQPVAAIAEIPPPQPSAAAAMPDRSSSLPDHRASSTEEPRANATPQHHPDDHVAPQQNIQSPEKLQIAARRGHGRALPK